MNRLGALASLFLVVVLVFIPIDRANAQSSSSYAPLRFWNVRNWYTAEEFPQHRFPDFTSAFVVEWELQGSPLAPCFSADNPATSYHAAEFLFYSANIRDNVGLEPGSYAEAYYLRNRCNYPETMGPYSFGSAAIRFMSCSDSGPWKHPYPSNMVPCVVSATQADPEKNRGAPHCPDQCFGDPVNAGSGQKFERKTEYSSVGATRLDFSWTYNSSGVPANTLRADLILGRNRAHTFLRRVSVFTLGAVTTAYVARPDGNAYRFNLSAGTWVPDPNVSGRLLQQFEADGTTPSGWRYDEGNVAEYFAADGSLSSIDLGQGHILAIDRDAAGRVSRVEDETGRALAFEYTTKGLLQRLVLPDAQDIEFSYSAKSDLAAVTYQDGSTVQYLYDEVGKVPTNTTLGRLTGVLDESGQRKSTTLYDSNGRVKEVFQGTSADKHTATYTYSNANGLATQSSVVYPSGITRTFSFVAKHGAIVPTLRAQTCPNCGSGQRSFSYDANGRANVVAEDGVYSDRDYDSLGRLIRLSEGSSAANILRTSETDWHGTTRLPAEKRVLQGGTVVSKSTWTYNNRGQALSTSQVDAQTNSARTTTQAYCEQTDLGTAQCPRVGLLKWVDGPRAGSSDRTTFEYYGAVSQPCGTSLVDCGYLPGDLWKATDPSGAVTEILAYDPAGRPLAVKDPNGVITQTQYHPRGWVSGVTVKGATTAEDRSTSYEYWPTGLVKKVTAPDGVFTSFEYDDAHRLTAVADSAGNRIEYTLDGAGNRIAENTKGSGGVLKRTLSRVYNTLGQLATQADAQASPTDFTYDVVGNAKTVTDALGHVTSNDYDPLNRLKRTLQDVGGIEAETKFEYDANDNLTKVTDPKGLDTTYTYNGFGDLVQLSSPGTGVTTYTYDSAGNRASQTDARGITTTYQYDALNRLTHVGYPTTSLNVSYTYDVTQPVCQAGETFSVGRLTLMVDGSGSTQYCHDRFGQVVRKVQTTNGVALTLQYAYTKGGQLQAMTYPDGTVVDYVRNAQGQITEVGVAQPNQAREILLTGATYHPFGPIAGWVYGNGRVMQRNVDLDYRPTSIQGGPGGLDLTYGYDAVGNLTSLSSGSPPPLEYGYDALGRLTESRDGPTQAIIDQYTYDKTGNRTSFTDSLGTKAYAYPSTSHRLSSVAGETRTYDAVGNTLSIGAARTFDYSDAGRMIAVSNGGITAMQYAYNGRGEQVRHHVGTTSTYALYDEAGHWVGDYAAGGSATQQALWMDDMSVGLISSDGKIQYVQSDHLGTPRIVIDPLRNLAVWSWDIKGDAFGDTPANQDADNDGAVFEFNMRFPGQRLDPASGLLYNLFRDYEPGTGRYVQSDPIGLAGGPTTFSYAGSMPTHAYDPSGLKAIRVPHNPMGPVPDGTIVCRGGVVTPWLNLGKLKSWERECVGDCLLMHEQSHARDAEKSNPGLCKYWGWVPFLYPVDDIEWETDAEFRSSELLAYAAELRCLSAKLRQGTCTSDTCQKVIRSRIDDITSHILPTVYNGTYPNGL